MGKWKYTIESIKQLFESESYQLLSTEYVYINIPLDFICPNGHKHKISLDSWIKGKRCKFCSNNVLVYEQVKQSFESEGYKLQSTEYKNRTTHLNYICPKGHKHKTTWINWLGKFRCPICSTQQWASKPEKEILEYIKQHYNGIIKPNDRTLIKNPKTNCFLELDIWLPELKKAIEYGAEYYHKNKYIKWKDNYKKQWCKENNINLLIINDDNWRRNKNFNIIGKFIDDNISI